MSYEAAEKCQTDQDTYLLTYLLTDHPSEEEAATHSSGSDDDEDTATQHSQSRNRKVTYLLTDHHMSDFTSGGELYLSEKEQSTKSRTASETASQPVSDIPQDVGNNN